MPSIELKFQDIVFDKKVQEFCNNPKFRCPHYSRSWACPPEAPYLEEEIKSYSKYILVYTKFDLNQYIEKIQAKHPNRKKNKILSKVYRKGIVRKLCRKEIKKTLSDLSNDLEDVLVIWHTHCRLCQLELDKPCSYDDGEPCRYPEKIQYSMEAVGINVTETAKKIGITLEWPPRNYLYRFGLICTK